MLAILLMLCSYSSAKSMLMSPKLLGGKPSQCVCRSNSDLTSLFLLFPVRSHLPGRAELRRGKGKNIRYPYFITQEKQDRQNLERKRKSLSVVIKQIFMNMLSFAATEMTTRNNFLELYATAFHSVFFVT